MLEKLGIFVRSHYKSILFVSALYTGLSVYWMLKLETKMQMSDMLPKDQPESVAYQYVLDNFKGVHAITIAVEGAEKNIKAYIEDVADDVGAIPHVEHVIYRNENEFFKKHGLLLLKFDEIDSLKGVITASSIRDFIAGLNDNFEKEYIAGDEPDRLRKDSREMLSAFNAIEDFLKLLVKDDSKESEIREISDAFIAGPAFMISPDRTMGIMSVRTSLEMTDIKNIIKLVEDVEGLVKERQKRHKVKAGVSGIVAYSMGERV